MSKRGWIRDLGAALAAGALLASAAQPALGAHAAAASAPCTRHAIRAGVRATVTGKNFHSLDGFGCARAYAWAAVTVNEARGNPVAEITMLLHARAGRWHAVSRALCQKPGVVPRRIYRPACETN